MAVNKFIFLVSHFATLMLTVKIYMGIFFWQYRVFGEPFLLVIHEGETLAEVKVRIQKKLEVADEEFSKVYYSFR